MWVWSLRQNLCQIFWTNILHEVYIYKHEVLFIEIPERKLKAKLARNTIFEGRMKFLLILGEK